MKSDKVWPRGIIIIMVIFIAWILGVVTIAVRNRPQLTSEHYYAEGYNLKELKARKAASEATGWQIRIQTLPVEQAQMPLVQMIVSEASGAPCDSLTGEVAFYRPSNQALDIPASSFFPIGAGKYLVKAPRPLEHGLWQAVAHLTRGQQSAEARVSFFVES